MKASIPVILFASGRGSNFEAIVEAVDRGDLACQILGLVCDRPQALVLEKAKRRGIRCLVIPPPPRQDFATPEDQRRTHEEEILRQILPLNPAFIVLAGYQRILTSSFIDRFRSPRGYSRIVNIHPSLLPDFPGLDAYRRAFEEGAKQTGVSIHLVETGVDQGPLCAQKSFSIEKCQTAEEVEALGLSLEHRLYPETLSWLLQEHFEVRLSEDPRGLKEKVCLLE